MNNQFCTLTHLVALCCACGFMLASCAGVPSDTPTLPPSTATHLAPPTPTVKYSTTPTLTATHSATPTATTLPTSSAAQILTDYDGIYQGTTSQGRILELKIEDGGVRSILVDFEIPGCDAKQYSPLSAYYGQVQGAIEDGTLILMEVSGLVITGTFTSATELSGSMAINTFLCEDSVTVTWSATTDFIPTTPTPLPDLAQLMPDLEIPDGLFLPEAGSSNVDQMDGILSAQGDWILVQSFQSIFPIPAGWTTIETGKDIIIGFSPNGNLDEPAVFIRLGGVGYIGDNRTSEEVMAEFEKEIKEIPSALLLAKKVVDPGKGYYFLTITNEAGRKQHFMVLFSEDVQGFFHRFLMVIDSENWNDYYPIAQKIVDHWVDLELKPLGMPLPDEISTANAEPLYAPPTFSTGTWEVIPDAQVGPISYLIQTLAVDQQNRVWVGIRGEASGTGTGLMMLDTNGQWVHFNPENSDLDALDEWAVATGRLGQVWAGTSMLDANGNWTDYTSHIPSNPAAIAIDQQDRVWFGTYANGVVMRHPNGNWETYTSEKYGLLSDRIEAIAIDAEGQVWAGGYAGLNRLNSDGTWTTYKPDSQWSEYEEVSAIAINGKGQIWVGTSEGLRRLDPKGKWTPLLLSEPVTALVVDKIDQLWVGTEAALFSFDSDGNKTTYTPENSGIAPGGVMALSLDAQGRIWIATTALCVLDANGNWETYLPDILDDPEMYDDWLDNFIHDSQGRVWIGNRNGNGLYVLNLDGHWTTYTGDIGDYIQALAIDSQDKIWVAGFYEGVSVIAPDGSWETYDAEMLELGDGFITALAVDQQDRVWLGTTDNLKMFDPSSGWRTYTTKDLGLGDVIVDALAIDQQGRVWAWIWVKDTYSYQIAIFTP